MAEARELDADDVKLATRQVTALFESHGTAGSFLSALLLEKWEPCHRFMRLFALVVRTILNRINEGLMEALFSPFMARAGSESEYNNTIKEPTGPAFCQNELIWSFPTKSMPSGFRTGTERAEVRRPPEDMHRMSSGGADRVAAAFKTYNVAWVGAADMQEIPS